jgi:GNAT superfamily N-acetyltransferase
MISVPMAWVLDSLAWILHFCRRRYRNVVLRFKYRMHFQTVSSLCPTSRTEVERLLSETHSRQTDHGNLLRDTEHLYTVTYRKQIVACVFVKAIDWCVQKALPGTSSSAQVEEDGPMLQISNVRALSVLSDHRRQGIASSLLRRIKKDAFRDGMLWVELHVDEKTDRSHEWLLSMYRKHNFIVLPRPQSAEYLLVCVDY